MATECRDMSRGSLVTCSWNYIKELYQRYLNIDHFYCLWLYFTMLCPLCFYLELEKWRSPEFYEQEVHRIQLPFSAKLAGAAAVGAEERQERRANQLRRLQEINARRREEKIQQDQERLDSLLAVQVLGDIHLNTETKFLSRDQKIIYAILIYTSIL